MEYCADIVTARNGTLSGVGITKRACGSSSRRGVF